MVWDCKYHFVWLTKYRYPVLGGDVGVRRRQLLRESAHAHEMVIHARAVNRDDVHMLVSIPPNPSVSRAAQRLKERSSHKFLSEFGILRKRYWGHSSLTL
jgi:putative transposase